MFCIIECVVDIKFRDAARAEFRASQGLADEASQEQPLYIGFLSRGKAFKAFFALANELRTLRAVMRESLLQAGRNALVEEVEGPLRSDKVLPIFQDGKN